MRVAVRARLSEAETGDHLLEIDMTEETTSTLGIIVHSSGWSAAKTEMIHGAVWLAGGAIGIAAFSLSSGQSHQAMRRSLSAIAWGKRCRIDRAGTPPTIV